MSFEPETTMKIIAIGDLHGKDCWKQIDPASYDQIIFMGDYVDAQDKCREAIIENLQAIITFKMQQPEKVILLLGNHDIQYLHYPKFQAGGFDSVIQPQLTSIFNEHKNQFQVVWQHRQYLFTHAGVSRKYWAWLQEMLEDNLVTYHEPDLAGYLNHIHKTDPHLLYVCGTKRGGFYPHGGPLWADEKETQHDHIEGFHQVVGHSRIYKIDTYTRSWMKDKNSSITYIDVLDQRTEFFEIDT